MIDLSKLNKEELISELSTMLELMSDLESQIEQEQNELTKQRRELYDEERALKDKYIYTDAYVRDKQRADNFCELMNLIETLIKFGIPALTLYILDMKSKMELGESYEFNIMRFILPLLVITGLGFLVVKFILSKFIFDRIRESVELQFKKKWSPFFESEFPKLINADSKYAEIKKKESEFNKKQIEIDDMRKVLTATRHRNNLGKRYYGYESTLIDYLKTHRAENIKEALQLIEAEWKHIELKKQLHQQNQQQLRHHQQQQQQLADIHYELQQQRLDRLLDND